MVCVSEILRPVYMEVTYLYIIFHILGGVEFMLHLQLCQILSRVVKTLKFWREKNANL